MLGLYFLRFVKIVSEGAEEGGGTLVSELCVQGISRVWAEQIH